MPAVRLSILLAGACLLVPAGAQAAERCAVPGNDWQRAMPQQAGMDPEKLRDAIDYGSSQLGFAIRVYRHGCLVGSDRLAPANDDAKFESWSMAKSVASMLFGRAMTERAISPDDPVGALLPEADRAHGEVRMVDLLTMSSGVHWNGFRDYNIFTQTDRVSDWLTLGFDHEPGTFFEYAQSAVAIVPKMVERATGTDPRAYLQRELFEPLGIAPRSWGWERDEAGNIEGFWGVRMRVDDYGRLGELLRRGGRWRGERLLSRDYVRRALTGSPTNGCYGWLIWTNDRKPCVGPRISSREVVDEYGYPGTPRDGFVFSGLFGQIVAVFPSQGIVIVRTGHDSNAGFAGGANWQIELFRRVLGAITDEPVDLPDDPPGSPIHSSDEGFQNAILDPGSYSKGAIPDRLPPAGPPRARAAILERGGKGIRGRRAFVRLHCPAAVAGAVQGCRGKLTAKGAKRRRYGVAAGDSERLGLRLRRKTVRRLTRRGRIKLGVKARNRDRAGGVSARERFRFEDAAERPRRAR